MPLDSTRVPTAVAEDCRARALLLAHARTACTDQEISLTRRAIRAWLEHHPWEVDLLLVDEAMTRPPGLRG